jgi:hypothetical protein
MERLPGDERSGTLCSMVRDPLGRLGMPLGKLSVPPDAPLEQTKTRHFRPSGRLGRFPVTVACEPPHQIRKTSRQTRTTPSSSFPTGLEVTISDEGAVAGFRRARTCRRAEPSAARVVATGKGGAVARGAARHGELALASFLRCDHAVAKCSYPWGMRTDQAVGAEVLRVLKPLGVHARLGRSKRWRSRRRLAADSWNWRAAGELRSLTCTPAIRCCGSDESSGRRRARAAVERGAAGRGRSVWTANPCATATFAALMMPWNAQPA